MEPEPVCVKTQAALKALLLKTIASDVNANDPLRVLFGPSVRVALGFPESVRV